MFKICRILKSSNCITCDGKQIQREFDHALILDESFQCHFINECILMFLCKRDYDIAKNKLTMRLPIACHFALRKLFQSRFSTNVLESLSTNCYLDVRIFSFLMLEFTTTLNLMYLTSINFHQAISFIRPSMALFLRQPFEKTGTRYFSLGIYVGDIFVMILQF